MENGIVCGSMRAEQRGLYTVFRAEVSSKSLCRLIAEYESGEVSLGVPAPEQGKMRLCASMPTSRLPEGKLLRGVLRTGRSDWTRFSGGAVGSIKLPAGYRNGNTFRFPWNAGDPLPCDALLCFYRLVRDQGCSYLEICLNKNGIPAE